MMKTGTERVTFVYLMYTQTPTGFTPELLGIYGSKKAAESHIELINGEVTTTDNSRKRVLQKINHSTGQFWYVEKHVVRSGR